MSIAGFGRFALSLSAVAAMLAGCGGRASDGIVPTSVVPDSFPYHKSFYSTGKVQDFKVPVGVKQLKVILLGAHGAGSIETRGGRVSAVILVTPGETLAVFVGGNASGATGGFNGGGDGGNGYSGGHSGNGGGGASDVRQHGQALANRILVSGGGGGQGGGQDDRYGDGGVGGGGGDVTGAVGGRGGLDRYNRSGNYYSGVGGKGGTQRFGGRGGPGSNCVTSGHGADGTLRAGGAGGLGGGYYDDPGGGGGGGGYYGGGGGGGGAAHKTFCTAGGGGGGGGSSYADRRATDVHMWRAWKESAGNGLVVISWQ